MVKKHQINIPREYLKKGDDDRVLARLMEGEIVIPLPYVKKAKQLLNEEKIKLPGL